MTAIQNKIDFALIIGVNGANPNGDPLNGNRPRQTVDGLGEISDVCVKRKIRNRIQDLGVDIFVKSDDRSDDGFKSLRERANDVIKQFGKDREKFAEEACAKWYDVRAFGQLFAMKGDGKDGLSVGIRGPVSIRPAFSVSPVNILEITQTKVCHPHIFRHQLRERNIVKSKHIFHRFHSDILLELAVFIKIGVRVLL